MEAKERGNKAFQAGDWQSAAKWYTAALDADPKLVAAYANRAACEIHLRQWEQGLADCNAALALESPPSLRVKVLWRKAVCVRHLGRSQAEWAATVQAGLALDSANEKLLDEQHHIFIRSVETWPSEYTPGSSPARGAPAPTPTPRQPPMAPLFAPPPRPLSYAAVLKLTRTKSDAAYEFWYNEVTGAELIGAHANGGVEPDTLDYVHEMIVLNPQYQDKNQEFMRALAKCPRYTSASLLADEALYKRAEAAAGISSQ